MKIWMVNYVEQCFFDTLDAAVQNASAQAKKEEGDFDIVEYTFSATRLTFIRALNHARTGETWYTKKRVVFTARWTGKEKAHAV